MVEVLVALLILVIGILSVIRLFPGGFIAIRDVQDANLADRLAQGQLETLKQNDAFLLDAVYMYTPQGFISNFPVTTINPFGNPETDFNDDYPNATNPIAAYDDINKTRYVVGEQFVVPAINTSSSDTATEGVSIHTLNDGPVVMSGNGQLYGPPAPAASADYTAPAPVDVYGQAQVHSAPWTARLGTAYAGISGTSNGADYDVPGSADLPSDLLAGSTATYAIDYTNQEIALQPQPYVQRFILAIKVENQATGANTVSSATYYIPLVIPAEAAGTTTSSSNYDGGWFPPLTYRDTTRAIVTDTAGAPSLTASGYTFTWLQGTAVLTCDLTTDASVAALQSDPNPYTYLVYNSDPALTGVNLGVLAVNPRLVGQTVSVSYMVYDWHILHENEDAPGSAGEQMPLTIDHIQPVGAVLDNQSIYPGIFQTTDVMAGGGNDTGAYDIEILDPDTGQSIGLSATANSGDDSVYNLDTNTGTPATDQFQVSYQNGYIILPTATGDAWSNAAHQHLRVFYSGDFDWAVALQKAPNVLTAVTSNPGAGQYSLAAANGQTNLDFPGIDIGQTIEVDNVTYTSTSGQLEQVPQVTGTVAPTPSYLPNPYTPYINLSESLPGINTADPITIGSVRGISVTSIVIWKERGNWKTESISTILSQGQ